MASKLIRWCCRLLVCLALVPLSSCSGCESPSYDADEDSEIEDDRQNVGDVISNEESQEEIQLTGRIETCNKCMGYGAVQDGLYGIPQICKFCWVSTWMRMQQGWTGFDGRYGMVDAAFNQLPSDYFDYLEMDAGGSYENNGNQREQIEAEIEQHERNIESMEEQLEYIEGSINRKATGTELSRKQKTSVRNVAVVGIGATSMATERMREIALTRTPGDTLANTGQRNMG